MSNRRFSRPRRTRPTPEPKKVAASDLVERAEVKLVQVYISVVDPRKNTASVPGIPTDAFDFRLDGKKLTAEQLALIKLDRMCDAPPAAATANNLEAISVKQVEGPMKRNFGIVYLLLVTCSRVALAGGVILYEAGTPEVGLASAGWAARAEDAATILTNPAGMTRLPNGDLMVGMQTLYADLLFSPDGNTTTPGGDGGNPVGLFPGGGLFYVHAASDRLRLGLALTGNFGLGLDYDDDWAGRYFVQDSTLIGVSVMPAVAWKVSDQFSIGAALNAMYGVFDTKVAVNNLLPSEPDGRLEIEDNDWGFGGNIGVLYAPSPSTRIGLTYTSRVKLDLGDVPEFSNLGPGMSAALAAAGLLDAPLDISMTVPQTAMGSFVHRLDDRWSLLGKPWTGISRTPGMLRLARR
ncbi:MAG: outer membrane protein transport protein [Acidobacteria bacterium]|nr:outer membrane protein transport protein [Acidobacteriota bacterium]